MPFLTSPHVAPVLLLIASNLFMTLAWYGHLKFTDKPLWVVVIASWMIAFVEYCLAVPANRIGYGTYSAAELKTIQEVVTLTIFVIFSVVYLKEAVTWNHLIGFAFIAVGAGFIFRGPIGS
ncbi:DMT family protein [Chthonobacter albigriseus]|uniref:DMT family protein n=1 Tax=Chthonobacter albigriseus TaxID=1683161 RepID=UPI0015EEA3BE|nr:DMT family protein [Chthonobacter albigriseus]